MTELAGKPSQSGQYTFSLMITDSQGSQITRTLTLNVTPLNRLTGSNSTINLTRGRRYDQQLNGTGGLVLTAIRYPARTSLGGEPGNIASAPWIIIRHGRVRNAGEICGTPTSTGSYSFTHHRDGSEQSVFDLHEELRYSVTNANSLYIHWKRRCIWRH